MRRIALATLVAAAALVSRVAASPPLITGDVPTADRGFFELYTGFRYQDTGQIERQNPHVEFVYGVADRWEISLEASYLSREGERGPDDVTIATKTVLVSETAAAPGVAVSYDYKFANADVERGLGSGGEEHDVRLRAQKTFGALTPIVNLGYVLVPDATIGGRRSARQDGWRASVAQEWSVTGKTKLLAEVYWRGADEPGGDHRLGWNAGFKHKARDHLSVHAAVGESLRPANRGGPVLRVYVGFKYEFAAPWRTASTRGPGSPPHARTEPPRADRRRGPPRPPQRASAAPALQTAGRRARFFPAGLAAGSAFHGWRGARPSSSSAVQRRGSRDVTQTPATHRPSRRKGAEADAPMCRPA